MCGFKGVKINYHYGEKSLSRTEAEAGVKGLKNSKSPGKG